MSMRSALKPVPGPTSASALWGGGLTEMSVRRSITAWSQTGAAAMRTPTVSILDLDRVTVSVRLVTVETG